MPHSPNPYEPQTLKPYHRAEAISIAEAAEIAQRTRRTLRDWCCLHNLGRRIGGQWAVSRVALAMYLDGDSKALAAYLRGDTFREPPHNVEAEQSLLGAILVNNDALERVAGFLRADHFYDGLHGKIYEACERQIRAGRKATPITLKTEFASAELVGELPVPQYLGRLAASAATFINAEDYGRTVFDLAARRKIIEAGQTMVATAYDAPIDHSPDKILEAAEIELTALAERGRSGITLVSASEAMTRVIDSAAEPISAMAEWLAYQPASLTLTGCYRGLSPVI